MAAIDGMLLEIDSYTENANTVKTAVITRLLEDGIITEKQATLYNEEWNMIVYKRSWFSKILSKTTKNDWQMKYVKFKP